MNFIIDFFDSHDNNAICIIIDKFSKKRYYVFCYVKNENIFIKITTKILIQYVFRIHDLSISIIFDRDFQFVIFVWKFFCKRFDIRCNFSTTFHSKIDNQNENANKKIEIHFCQYCNYMQNDWFEWIIIIEFVDNNKNFFVIDMFFFVNKNFDFRIIIEFDKKFYEFIRERFLIVKIENIIDIVKTLLEIR